MNTGINITEGIRYFQDHIINPDLCRAAIEVSSVPAYAVLIGRKHYLPVTVIDQQFIRFRDTGGLQQG